MDGLLGPKLRVLLAYAVTTTATKKLGRFIALYAQSLWRQRPALSSSIVLAIPLVQETNGSLWRANMLPHTLVLNSLFKQVCHQGGTHEGTGTANRAAPYTEHR